MSENVILNQQEINHKIRRIALQILEENIKETSIVVAGIANNGFVIAEQLVAIMKEYSKIETILCEVKINKKQLLEPVTVSIDKKDYENKSVILVDDVLNSGGTLIYGVKHFLDTPLKKLKTAVLVNRSHKTYPIKADFKGVSLSTSLSEHVEVVLENDNARAVLV